MSAAPSSLEGMVSVRIGSQTFGVPVMRVQDVIAQTAISTVPLAPPEVAGTLNLRGRIVTAMDMRERFGLPRRTPEERFMSVILERGGELYALLVDDVGDVLWLPASTFEPLAPTLSAGWRALCVGLYRLEDALLLALDVDKVLTLAPPTLAAPQAA
jgi:purine-binding chemotaxis protein CheW